MTFAEYQAAIEKWMNSGGTGAQPTMNGPSTPPVTGPTAATTPTTPTATTPPVVGGLTLVDNSGTPKPFDPNTPFVGPVPQGFNPPVTTTTTVAKNINPATGKQWTTAELMSKYYATFGKYPQASGDKNAGDVFNTWAGEQTGGLGWDSSGGVGPILGDSGANADGRNLLNEATANLQAQIATAGPAFAAYQQYAPQYAQVDLNTLGNMMFGAGQWGGTGQSLNDALTRMAAGQTNLGNQLARQAAIGDITGLGTQLTDAQKAANPQLWATLESLQAQAGQAQANPFQTQLGDMFKTGPQFSPITAGQVQTPNVQGSSISGAQVGAPNTVSAQANDLGLQTASGMLTSGGPSSIQQTLERQAAQDLALGRGLSAEDTRNAQQAAREAWGARGLINSTGAVAEEVLNRDALGRQREAERRAFAQGVDTTGFGQRQQGFANALGLSGAAQGYAGMGLEAQRANQAAALQAALANQGASLTTQQANQQNALQAALANQGASLTAQQANQNAGLAAQQAQAGLGMQAWGQQTGLGQYLAGLQSTADQQKFNNLASVAQMYGQNQLDPARILGVGTANQGTNTGLFGAATGVTSGQTGSGQALSQFNPFSAYGADVANTNFNANWTAQQNALNNAANMQIAKTQAGATKTAGIAQGIGNILGSLLGKCWVARSVYGVDNPKWLMFRHWLTTKSPQWFYNLYIKHGPGFAKWLDRNPWAKPPIRFWMDSRIRSLSHQDRVNVIATMQEAY